MALLNPKTVDLKDGRTIVIRCADDRDAASLLESNKLSFIDGTGMILTVEEYTLSEDDVKNFVQAHIDGPKDLMLVADFEGTVVGNIGFRIAKPRMCGHWGTFAMAVRPGWRGCGIGNALLTRLLEWAASMPEIEKVTLAVRADNTRAIALYEKHGFVLSGCDKAYLRLSDGSFVDDLRMEKFVR
ncbi:MAG TPA: GNAT family N-acetyltransferase [Terriglobia bacterium]|nr:GNAT family N-acetyltransferase [Terriglobia bacterium]